MDKKKKILDFLNGLLLGVLSTVNEQNKPESAVMGFGVMDNLELFFGTNNFSRKYKNLKSHPNISFVIGWDNDVTVQYEGVASEFTNNSVEAYKRIYFMKNPEAKKYEKYPGQTFFKVIPKWIRYSDLSEDPGEVFEVTF